MAVTMSSLYDRAAIIPGRSMTRSKAPGRLWPIGTGPTHCVRGDGPYLYDEQQRPYIDMLCALGAISIGYREAYYAPGSYSLPHLDEVRAAEAVLAHVAPWASSVRFTKTGSEATHAAYRIAKALTSRDIVLVGDWAYHGWHEWSAYPAKFPHGADLNTIVHYTKQDRVAAVFIEPHRWEPIDPDWLRAVRDYCDRVGALLVFDEMIYGGRWALGGATEYFGVVPDLACFGKAFGNGQAVAFVVGNAALQEHGELVSGTYSGDVCGLHAVVETIGEYVDDGVVETLWTRGRQLANGLDEICAGTAICREGAPAHQRLVFPHPDQGARFSAEMVSRGVIWHPAVTNIMAAHTPAIIDEVIEAAAASLKAMGL
jgi:glutamate-1-semialdehyde 2,1-aminomutase